MTARSRIVLVVHRVVLGTGRTPLARLWGFAYRAAARVWAAFLARGEDASAYVRGSLGKDDALPGLSDIDVAVVLADPGGGRGVARERVTGRWTRLRRAVPVADLLLDYPLVFEDGELGQAIGSSALTSQVPVYLGQGVSRDKVRLLERPGLYGATDGWRLIRGRERLPRERPRDAQLRRIAAWLELAYWWQWAAPACADPSGPRTASLCVKLVSEPARIWLWLAHGERGGGRMDVLQRALRRIPDEEEGVRRAMTLLRALPYSPEPPLAELLPVLVRLSSRIAEHLAGEVEAEGETYVRLAGGDEPDLVLALGRSRAVSRLPLCDWKALVNPGLPDETFAPAAGDPGDPQDLGAAFASQGYGPLPALQGGPLMVFPGERWRAGLRAVACRLTDPVSFALAEGRRTAAFPDVPGWSAADTARRAVAEHRAWLLAAPRPVPGLDSSWREGGIIARLFTAARAGLFLESLESGTPELPLTVAETAHRLGARSEGAAAVAGDGIESYREFAVRRTRPSERTLAALRGLVSELPAYLDPLRNPAGLLGVQPHAAADDRGDHGE